uniref:HAT C-terminal dimerisation domain-containing protein n=2 Tax=Photinus pyralis TaxID=7054 RepID=A0A1Y1N7S0_PHOPY
MKQMKLFDPILQKLSKQKQLDKNIMQYVTCSMKPLSTVDDPYFIKIITDLNPELKTMSRRTLGRNIDKSYAETMQKLKTILQNINHVSTTADIWSTKHKSFMGVTAHWISQDDLVRHSCVLACRRFKGSHTYDKVAEMLYDITSDFGLRHDQLISTITDNGSNFVKAFAEHGIKLNIGESTDDEADEESEDHDTQGASEELSASFTIPDKDVITLPNHLRCASHTLNLLATTDFMNAIKNSAVSRIHYPALAKCTAIWNASRRPKTSEVIVNVLSCSLTYPCPTRWNSLYDSILQLLKYKEHLASVNINLGLGPFKEVQLEYLEDYCTLMKPIAGAIDYLQNEKTCFYGQLLPTLFSLRQRLHVLQEKSLRHAAPLLKTMENSLYRRFKHFLTFQ